MFAIDIHIKLGLGLTLWLNFM